MMKEAMTPTTLQGLRVVLDSEKAAINAAKAVFPSASVERCAFHLAQARKRKRYALGLRQYVRAAQRSGRIKSWWSTIKGFLFLSPHLHRRVPALWQPPVTQTHAAYNWCRSFLEYLRTNWYAGPFNDLWNKWDVEELKTSNIAESFNRLLGVVLGVNIRL
ncbi:hypothetical protein GCK32_022373 [Trichostrongylus colubriformis]|uniref:MULE transposase domain-containing protein n=1 Tax=Trichostrongylus colubriformis TaxID=6319 RepID=A0AAN8FNA0_TRICO